MPVLDLISAVVGALAGLYGVFYAVIALFGLKKRKSDFPKTAPSRRIAAVIAARNEEGVIGQLVESLMKQDYPAELFDVVVVPNNCTDDTEGAALRAGARVVRVRCEVKSKGEALRDAFSQLLDENLYDAYAVFDADNLAHPGFMQAANDALNAGARIAQGYRDSKNPFANWVSGGSSVFYWFMDRLYNHARRVIGSSAALNGTGFVVSASLLRETGFETHSLTEDLEYTAQCVIRGEKIYWMDDAITFDEQPERLRDALTQRKRWFGGAWQCKKYYFRDLFKTRSLIAVDMMLVFGSVYALILGALPLLTGIISMAVYAANTPEYLWPLVGVALVSALVSVIAMQAFAILVCALEKKSIRRMWKGILLFPLFMALWMLANWSCILTGPPQWTPIRHKAVSDADR